MKLLRKTLFMKNRFFSLKKLALCSKITLSRFKQKNNVQYLSAVPVEKIWRFQPLSKSLRWYFSRNMSPKNGKSHIKKGSFAVSRNQDFARTDNAQNFPSRIFNKMRATDCSLERWIETIRYLETGLFWIEGFVKKKGPLFRFFGFCNMSQGTKSIEVL